MGRRQMSDDSRDMRAAEFLIVMERAEGSTHDVIRDLLAYCAGTPVDFERIYEVVNAKVPQEREAVAAVLRAFPYFIPDERDPGRWSFEPDVHRRVMAVLGRRNVPAQSSPRSTESDSRTGDSHVAGGAKHRLGGAAAVHPKTSGAPLATSEPSIAAMPGLSRYDAARLLSIPPRRVWKAMELLQAGRSLERKDQQALEATLPWGWCAKGKDGCRLTQTGALILRDRRQGAALIRESLRTLPAFLAVENRLATKGRLGENDVRATVQAVPYALRLEPARLYAWLAWIIEETGSGSVTATAITAGE